MEFNLANIHASLFSSESVILAKSECLLLLTWKDAHIQLIQNEISEG